MYKIKIINSTIINNHAILYKKVWRLWLPVDIEFVSNCWFSAWVLIGDWVKKYNIDNNMISEIWPNHV